MIDSEEYREGKQETRQQRSTRSKRKVTRYLWYNGATTLKLGEKSKRKSEEKGKAKKKREEDPSSRPETC